MTHHIINTKNINEYDHVKNERLETTVHISLINGCCDLNRRERDRRVKVNHAVLVTHVKPDLQKVGNREGIQRKGSPSVLSKETDSTA